MNIEEGCDQYVHEDHYTRLEKEIINFQGPFEILDSVIVEGSFGFPLDPRKGRWDKIPVK